MKLRIKKSLMKVPLFRPIIKKIKGKRREYKLLNWEKNGGRIPPPHIVKQFTLRYYAKKFGLNILVETGTYQGDMVAAMSDAFNHIYSIELSEELYNKAKERFRNQSHIDIIHGDSGIVLKDLVKKINKPVLFWLDGHYSGGETAKADYITPIFMELEHIFESEINGHLIIIDDARLFRTNPDYPNLKELKYFINKNTNSRNIEIKNDSIILSNFTIKKEFYYTF